MSLRLQKSAAGSSVSHRPIAIIEGGARSGQYLFLTDPFAKTEADPESASESEADSASDASVSGSASASASDEEVAREVRKETEKSGGRAVFNNNREDGPDAAGSLSHLHFQGREEEDDSTSSSDESYAPSGAKRKRHETVVKKTRKARKARASPSMTRITLAPDEHFFIEPTHLKGEYRDIVYLSGQSGCGKSTLIKKFAERYRRVWPRRHIVLVSALEEDSTLRTNEPPLYIQRLKLESLTEHPVQLDELQDVLLIFDDVEGMPRETAIAVQELADLVGNRGRHQATSLLYASHLSTDYKRTRNLLMESHWYVFYPSATSAKQLVHLLSTYGGLDREQVHAARRLPSRWVALRKMYPPCILYDGGAYILHETGDSKPARKLKKGLAKVVGKGTADDVMPDVQDD